MVSVDRWDFEAEAHPAVALDGGEYPDGDRYKITIGRHAYSVQVASHAPMPTVLPGGWGHAVVVAADRAVFGFPEGGGVRRWPLESPFVEFVCAASDRLVFVYETGLLAVDDNLATVWERPTDVVVHVDQRTDGLLVEQMDGPMLIINPINGVTQQA